MQGRILATKHFTFSMLASQFQNLSDKASFDAVIPLFKSANVGKQPDNSDKLLCGKTLATNHLIFQCQHQGFRMSLERAISDATIQTLN